MSIIKPDENITCIVACSQENREEGLCYCFNDDDFKNYTGICSCWFKDITSSAYCSICKKIKDKNLEL